MPNLARVLATSLLAVYLTSALADPSEPSFEDFEEPAPPAAAAAAAPAKRWFVIIPSFVMHGIDPSGGANRYMPRRLTDDGRFVATPGLGVEFQGHGGLDVAAAFVKDCYDNAAGALQVGQHWRLGGAAWDLGYSVGVYVRQTPIACMTSTITTTTVGLIGRPIRTDRLTTRRCAFQDNLPLRYTTRVGDGFVDVIPTPFLHLAARVFHGSFDVYVKAISNFYLNEFGFAIPF